MASLLRCDIRRLESGGEVLAARYLAAVVSRGTLSVGLCEEEVPHSHTKPVADRPKSKPKPKPAVTIVAFPSWSSSSLLKPHPTPTGASAPA
ncbi:MAG: hypothetical protein WDW36_000450 [Sanguina aurantia]